MSRVQDESRAASDVHSRAVRDGGSPSDGLRLRFLITDSRALNYQEVANVVQVGAKEETIDKTWGFALYALNWGSYIDSGIWAAEYERHVPLSTLAKSGRVREEVQRDTVNGAECLRVDVETDTGLLSIWSAPSLQNAIVKVTLALEVPGVRYDSYNWEVVYDDFRRHDGYVIPFSAELRYTAEGVDGSYVTETSAVRRTSLAIGENARITDSDFSDDFIPNETRVVPLDEPDHAQQLIWLDGEIVDQADADVAARVRENVNAALAERADMSGEGWVTYWPVLVAVLSIVAIAVALILRHRRRSISG